MNQFFYESRGKEKLKELMREGQASQAIQRDRATKPVFRRNVPKLILSFISAILGIA